MKTIKNIKYSLVAVLVLLCFNACEDNDSFEFTAKTPTGDITFTSTFQSEYILTNEAKNNIGERFVWNAPDYGVPTPVTYTLEGSATSDFAVVKLIGETTETNLGVTIENMLDLAKEAGLDNDPNTQEQPNTGEIYFRLKASLGSQSGEAKYSEVQALFVKLVEASSNNASCEFDQLWLVGAGVPDAGWGWNSPVQLPCTGNGVYSGNVTFDASGDANFRFFTEKDNWDSGRNYPFYQTEGYTIDSNFENAMDDSENFKFIGTSGNYYLTVDTVNKTITLGSPQATGTCEFEQLWVLGAGATDAGWSWSSPVQILCVGDGVYSGNIKLQNNNGMDNNFRFFTEKDKWESGRNYPYYEAEGYTIDVNLVNAMDGDKNFAFVGTTGTFKITIDTVNKTISLE